MMINGVSKKPPVYDCWAGLSFPHLNSSSCGGAQHKRKNNYLLEKVKCDDDVSHEKFQMDYFP